MGKEEIEYPKPITYQNKTQLKANVLERQTQTPTAKKGEHARAARAKTEKKIYFLICRGTLKWSQEGYSNLHNGLKHKQTPKTCEGEIRTQGNPSEVKPQRPKLRTSHSPT